MATQETSDFDAYEGFTPAQREAVERGNALRLFPRFAR